MEEFGGGEGEPNNSVSDDQNADGAPDDQTQAIKRRLRIVLDCDGVTRELASPAVPEATQAVRNFRRRKQNHQADAENARTNQVLNEGVAHGARINWNP